MVWYFSEALRFEAKGRRHYVGIRARDSGKVDVFGSYYPRGLEELSVGESGQREKSFSTKDPEHDSRNVIIMFIIISNLVQRNENSRMGGYVPERISLRQKGISSIKTNKSLCHALAMCTTRQYTCLAAGLFAHKVATGQNELIRHGVSLLCRVASSGSSNFPYGQRNTLAAKKKKLQ